MCACCYSNKCARLHIDVRDGGGGDGGGRKSVNDMPTCLVVCVCVAQHSFPASNTHGLNAAAAAAAAGDFEFGWWTTNHCNYSHNVSIT